MWNAKGPVTIQDLFEFTRNQYREDRAAREHTANMLSAAMVELKHQVSVLTDALRGSQRHVVRDDVLQGGKTKLHELPKPRPYKSTVTQVAYSTIKAGGLR